MQVRKMISSASGAMNGLRAASHEVGRVLLFCQIYLDVNWY